MSAFYDSLFQAALGKVDPEQLEAINTVQNSGRLDYHCPVLDTEGNYLEKDGVYRYRGELIRITEWKFGGGNMMDTYYWVWFLKSSDMQRGRVTVDAKYNKEGRTYQSKFEPIEE